MPNISGDVMPGSGSSNTAPFNSILDSLSGCVRIFE